MDVIKWIKILFLCSVLILAKSEAFYENFFRDTTISQKCQYRNVANLPDQIFSIHADLGCYNYTRSDLKVNGTLKFRTDCSLTFMSIPYIIPGLINDDGTACSPVFHHNNTRVQEIVANSFQNEAIFQRWIQCCEDALKCCTDIIMTSIDQENYCPAVWDGWTCYEPIAAGSTAEKVCSKYAYTGQGPQCNHYSYKECQSDGTWIDQTDYTTCAVSPRLIARTRWHMAMLYISIIICAPGLIILIFYKSLRSQKMNMIRNLILAIVVRNCLVLMSKSLIIMDELTATSASTVMSENGVACRILAFFEKIAGNAVFTCMLLEAIYVHQLFTNAFATRRYGGINMFYFYIGGAAISVIMPLAWAITMAVNLDAHCWVVTDGTDYHWINDTPRLLMLFINCILLIHIIFIIWKTFKNNENENHPLRRTAKVSLICLPLFGMPILLVVVRPNTDSCGWEQFYYFVAYAIEGLQGIFVVTLRCYTDRDVKKIIFRFLNVLLEFMPNKCKKILQSSMRNDGTLNLATDNDRRTTLTTTADTQAPKVSVAVAPNIPSIMEEKSTEKNIKLEDYSRPDLIPVASTSTRSTDGNKHDISSMEFINDAFTDENEFVEFDKESTLKDANNQKRDINSIQDDEENDVVLDPRVLFRNRETDGIIFLNANTKENLI